MKRRKILGLCAVFLFSLLSTGLATLNGVDGVSYFDTTAKKIYAGYAGVCESPTSGSTCNTCTDPAGSGILPCNQKSIHGALNVLFSFQTSADITGRPIALFVGSSAETANTQLVAGLASGKAHSLSTTWSSFCNRATGLNSDCSVSSSADQTVSTDLNFYIGADENNSSAIESNEKLAVPVVLHSISRTNTGLHNQATCPDPAAPSGYGLCQYSLVTGDEKLIVQDAESKAQATPPSGSPEFSAVAFFAYQMSGDSSVIVPASVSNGSATNIIVKNITSATDFTLSPDSYLPGLGNYARYCVIAGQMNLAQNIFAFTTIGFAPTDICVATSEVVGLLDDKKCFISTAAFGSEMSSEVQIFRQFRNQFLLNSYLGAEFIKAYYKFGPVGAKIISRSEILKSITRGFLYPLLGFSWVAVNYGFWPAALVLLLSLMTVFQFFKKIRTRVLIKGYREKIN